MTTRREFLGDAAGAMAGIVFVGCGLMGTPPAQAQARRREVVVNGRRAKVIDVHAHCAVPEAMALIGLRLGAPGSLLPPLLHVATQASERLRAMDEQGIDVEALSINPYWYTADRDVATQIVKIQNEKLAEACAANPERFVAFATVALQYPDLAAQQLEEGVRKHGLRGARRWLPAVVFGTLRPWVPDPSRRVPRRDARANQEEPVGVSQAPVLRHDGVQPRGRASPRRRGGRGPAPGGHRLSVSVDEDR